MKSKGSMRVAKDKTRGGALPRSGSVEFPNRITKMPGAKVKRINKNWRKDARSGFTKPEDFHEKVKASGYKKNIPKTNTASKPGVFQGVKPSKVKNPRANAVAKAQAANKMKAVGKKINSSPTSGFNRRGKK